MLETLFTHSKYALWQIQSRANNVQELIHSSIGTNQRCFHERNKSYIIGVMGQWQPSALYADETTIVSSLCFLEEKLAAQKTKLKNNLQIQHKIGSKCFNLLSNRSYFSLQTSYRSYICVQTCLRTPDGSPRSVGDGSICGPSERVGPAGTHLKIASCVLLLLVYISKTSIYCFYKLNHNEQKKRALNCCWTDFKCSQILWCVEHKHQGAPSQHVLHSWN